MPMSFMKKNFSFGESAFDAIGQLILEMWMRRAAGSVVLA
jgi:hypothetical protein